MDRIKQNAKLRLTFADYLSANGYRNTPSRMWILDVVLAQSGRFAPQILLNECTEAGVTRVSRATVFNTLPLLEEAGIVRRLAHDREVTYEVIRQTMQLKARQQLVCRQCGKVQRLQAPKLAAWLGQLPFRDFTPDVDSAMLYLQGLCSKCRRAARKTNQKNQVVSHKTK